MLAEDQNPAAGLLRVIIYDVTGESSSCAMRRSCAAMHGCRYVMGDVMWRDATGAQKGIFAPKLWRQACPRRIL